MPEPAAEGLKSDRVAGVTAGALATAICLFGLTATANAADAPKVKKVKAPQAAKKPVDRDRNPQPGQRYPKDKKWSNTIHWGSHTLTSGVIKPAGSAWKTGTVGREDSLRAESSS